MDPEHPLAFDLSASYLIVSLIWSTVGGGYLMYARKERSTLALITGAALIAISWLISSAIWMSLVAVAIMIGAYYWSQRD